MSTKTLENLYAQLTPAELFCVIMAAMEFLVLVEEADGDSPIGKPGSL